MELTHGGSIKEAAARVGLKFKGLSHSPVIQDRQNYPSCVKDLLQGIDDINTCDVSCGIRAIRDSDDIRRKANELFYKIGAELWPDDEKNLSPFWLLPPYHKDTPPVNPFHLYYPRKLYYSQLSDRATLQQGFYILICYKVLNYHSNNRKKPTVDSETTDPLDSECLPNSEASQHSDLEHNDVDSAEESDYSATRSKHPKPKRPKSSKSTPRATGRKAMQSYGAPVAPMMGATTSKRLTELKNTNNTTRKVPQSPQYQREYATSSGNRQEKRRNRAVSSQTCDDATSDAPGHGEHIIFDPPASDAPSPSRTMENLPERQGKRPANDNIHVANSKKSKLPDKVRPSNPRLIVILKLKREKVTPHPDTSAEKATDRRPTGPSSDSQLPNPREGSSFSSNNHDHSHFGPHGYYTPGSEASNSAKCFESEKNHAQQEHNPPSVPPAAFVVDAIDESHNHSVAEEPLQHQAPKEHGRDDLQKAASITSNTSGGNDAGAPEVDWLHVQKLRAEWFAAARATGRRTRPLAPSEIPRNVASFKEMFPWAKSLSDEHTEQVILHHVRDITMAQQRVTADQTSFVERGVQEPDADTANGNIANTAEAVSGNEFTQDAQATGDMSVDKSRPE